MDGLLRNCICHCKDLEVFTCACKVIPEHIESFPTHYIQQLNDFVSRCKEKLADYQKLNFISTKHDINELLNQTQLIFNYDESTLLQSINAQEKSLDLITKKLIKQDIFSEKTAKSIASFESYLKKSNSLDKNKLILTKILQKLNNQLIIVFRPNLVHFYDCLTRHWKKIIFPGIDHLSSVGFPYILKNSSFFYFKMRSNSGYLHNLKFDIIEKKVYELPKSNILYFHSNPVLFNQRIYFFGGKDINNEESKYAEFFNINNCSWASVSFMPRPDSSMIAVEYSGFIFVLSKRYNGFLVYNLNDDNYTEQLLYSNEEIIFVSYINGVFNYIGKRMVYYCDDNSNLVAYGSNDVLSDSIVIRDYLVLDDKAYFAGGDNRIYCFCPNFREYGKIKVLENMPNLN